MPSRPYLTLAAAALLLAGCNKPAPTPEAAVPDTGAVDTVAAAGAPIADSANAMVDSVNNATDSIASTTDSVTVVPTDSVADTTMNN
jgi:PBP1b-binding outer membrane lipoprotein LpoB